MSTKRIRELVEYVRTHCPAGRQLAQAAALEVSAIEDAAKGIVMLRGIQARSEAMDLMESIAKETPDAKPTREYTVMEFVVTDEPEPEPRRKR